MLFLQIQLGMLNSSSGLGQQILSLWIAGSNPAFSTKEDGVVVVFFFCIFATITKKGNLEKENCNFRFNGIYGRSGAGGR